MTNLQSKVATEHGQHFYSASTFSRILPNRPSKRGKELKSTSKVEVQLLGKPLIADMVFRSNMSDGENRLFVLELNRQPKAERLVEEIQQHAKAIALELYDQKYDHPHSYRVLNVFKSSKTMKTVMKKLSEEQEFSTEY